MCTEIEYSKECITGINTRSTRAKEGDDEGRRLKRKEGPQRGRSSKHELGGAGKLGRKKTC